MFLSIVIPVYNEEGRLLKSLQNIVGFLDTYPYLDKKEIIIIDDGSKDTTREIAERFSKMNHIPTLVLKNEVNRGKGYAVKRGVFLSKGDYILFTDADLSTPIEEIKKFIPLLCEDYEVIIGSRALKDSQVLIPQPWYREAMGKIFNLFVQVLVMRGIKDTQCGFKVFKARVAKEVFQRARIDRFAFDVEALVISRKLQYRIKEVPVVWINSYDSKVHIIKGSFRMLIDLFRIALYNLIGFYN